MVKLLLRNNADINIKNSADWTVLHLAIQLNFHEMAQLLIENGADIEAEDDNHNTPLFKAVYKYTSNDEKRSTKVIELLLKTGADKFRKNKHGVGPIDMVSDRVRKEITHLF